jgi:hypothetical protein
MRAASCGHVVVVDLLLSKGARIDLLDAEGWSALHHASAQGHDRVVSRLIAYGADPNGATSNGLTPLYIAAYGGWGDALRALLAEGADPTMVGPGGLTAEDVAVQEGHRAVVEVFRPRSSPGSTPERGGIRLGKSSWSALGALEGQGNAVTEPSATGMPWRIRWQCSADDNMLVWLMGPDGERDLVVNEIGPGSGEAYPMVPADGHYLQVEHHGRWQLVIEER